MGVRASVFEVEEIQAGRKFSWKWRVCLPLFPAAEKLKAKKAKATVLANFIAKDVSVVCSRSSKRCVQLRVLFRLRQKRDFHNRSRPGQNKQQWDGPKTAF